MYHLVTDLHNHSSHPEHIKKLIVYGQALCLKKDFSRDLVNMKEWFFALGYSEKMVKKQIKQVVFGKTDKHWKILLKEHLLLLHSILHLLF